MHGFYQIDDGEMTLRRRASPIGAAAGLSCPRIAGIGPADWATVTRPVFWNLAKA